MQYFAMLAFGISTSLSLADYAPYSPPLLFDNSVSAHFIRRSDKCATSCGSNICCGKKAACALDSNGNVACCPFNSVCTGTVAAGAQPTAVPLAVGVPSAPAPGSGISHAISGTSTLSNQYYPFPVMATTFKDAAECTTSFSSCQAESAKCTGFVEGGGGGAAYGVTVSAQASQITEQVAMPASSAESICSSLSQEACNGLQISQCSTLGGAKATSSGGTFVAGEQSNAGAVPTKCVIGMGIAVVVGLIRNAL